MELENLDGTRPSLVLFRAQDAVAILVVFLHKGDEVVPVPAFLFQQFLVLVRVEVRIVILLLAHIADVVCIDAGLLVSFASA